MTPQLAPSPLNRETARAIPLFAGLTSSELQPLAAAAQVLDYAAGEVILRQGDSSQFLWVLLSGKCAVIREATLPGEESVVLDELEPYAQFGEMSFFQPAPHSASVRAITPGTLLRLSRADIDRLNNDGCCGAYKLTVNVVQCLAERLRHMDEWVSRLVREDASLRETGQRSDEWSTFRDKLFTQWTL